MPLCDNGIQGMPPRGTSTTARSGGACYASNSRTASCWTGMQSHQNETYELCDNVYIQYADSYITKMEEVFNAGSSMFLSHNGIQKMPLRDNTIAP